MFFLTFLMVIEMSHHVRLVSDAKLRELVLLVVSVRRIQNSLTLLLNSREKNLFSILTALAYYDDTRDVCDWKVPAKTNISNFT